MTIENPQESAEKDIDNPTVESGIELENVGKIKITKFGDRIVTIGIELDTELNEALTFIKNNRDETPSEDGDFEYSTDDEWEEFAFCPRNTEEAEEMLKEAEEKLNKLSTDKNEIIKNAEERKEIMEKIKNIEEEYQIKMDELETEKRKKILELKAEAQELQNTTPEI